MTRLHYCLVTLTGIVLAGVALAQTPENTALTQEQLIAEGRYLFFNETFDGNSRTCGSCHPAENNFTLDPAFIATLPDDDPLFVAPDDPRLLAIEGSPYRRDERPKTNDEIMVIGYADGDDARAYPAALLDHHELVNDRIGGKPVTVGW